MKNILPTIYLLLALTACGEKQNETPAAENTAPLAQAVLPENFEKLTFSYTKDNLPAKCQSDNQIVCEIEKVVKCALKNTAAYCDKNTMPDFIFYDDSMFAEGDVDGRPTEQSFSLKKLKPLDENTVEVLTKGECDKNWFGACRGNVIYVMSNKSGQWLVKEVYAIETIK